MSIQCAARLAPAERGWPYWATELKTRPLFKELLKAPHTRSVKHHRITVMAQRATIPFVLWNSAGLSELPSRGWIPGEMEVWIRACRNSFQPANTHILSSVEGATPKNGIGFARLSAEGSFEPPSQGCRQGLDWSIAGSS